MEGQLFDIPHLSLLLELIGVLAVLAGASEIGFRLGRLVGPRDEGAKAQLGPIRCATSCRPFRGIGARTTGTRAAGPR